MSELDSFEIRFAAAYRRHVDQAPRQMDAEAIVRAVTAQAHRRSIAWPWTIRPLALGPAHALAWLVILGLLLAMVAAAVFVGSQRPAVVFGCPPGSAPNAPGPVDQARPLAGDQGQTAVAFDRRAGKLVAVTNTDTGVETWTFDVCTNTWSEMHPNQQPPIIGWTELAYDVASDTTNLLSSDTDGTAPGTVWAYDLQADTWAEKRAAPTYNWVSLAYDPVTGLVVAKDHSAGNLMWTYDAGTDAWTPIHQANAGPEFGAIAYDASVDRLVAYGDGGGGSPPYETWLFDIRTGAWSRSAAERPAVVGWLTAPGIVYDEAAERTVIFMRTPLTAYDASADRWQILAEATAVSPTLMAYDPVNRRLVGWGSGGMGPPDGAVEALDLVTGQWTVLLEPLEE